MGELHALSVLGWGISTFLRPGGRVFLPIPDSPMGFHLHMVSDSELQHSSLQLNMEEFTGKEEWIGLLATDGDADAPNEKSYIKNAKNETETTLGLFQM